jgi:4-amino-4-deoxy-L-arabinose transferase-like glycosyltransferase
MNAQLESRNGLVVPVWLVWLIAIGFVFGGLGSFGILDNNEGLYAEIPREMMASHDWHLWIIPHLNGLPYMEKPPLLYWLTALSFALFGESEWSARLVPALSALGCVALLLRFGVATRRPLAGRIAGIVFITGMGVTAMSHVLMFDMLLTVMLTGALMHAWRYLADGETAQLRIAYGFLAFALLAKGLVAVVLFGLVVAAFTVLDTRSPIELLRAIGKWFRPSALAVFVAIAAPWHIVASMVEPIFAWFYFINEHVLRFLGKREPHDYYAGAWWYYLPRMVLYLFPWSFLLLGLVARRAASSDWQADSQSTRLGRFLLLAWLMPLLFFSISSAKANYYLIAVMPFAAFHLATVLEARDFLTPARRAMPALIVAALALIALAVAARRLDPAASSLVVMGMTQRDFVLAVLAAASAVGLVTAFASWRTVRGGAVGYLMLATLVAFVLGSLLPALEPTISTRQTARYLQEALPRHAVYLYRNFEEQSSLPFYLEHAVPVVDMHSNDLYWGNRLRSNDIAVTDQHFQQRVREGKIAIVVMDRQLKEFMAKAYAGAFSGQKHIGNSTIFFN